MKRDFSFWLLQITGWLLLVYLVYAQAIPAFDYDLGVAMGTQESVVAARDAAGWQLANEAPYWIVLPLIALWGAWGLWRVSR